MAALLLLGLAIGMDNFFVGTSLGTLGLSPQRRHGLTLGFGLFEGLMPLAGFFLGRELALRFALPWLEQGLLFVTALLIILGALHGGAFARRFGRSPWLMLLPLLLSFDNLATGSALGAIGFPPLATMAIVGSLSAALAALGLHVGNGAASRAPVPVRLLAGVSLLVIAVLDVL